MWMSIVECLLYRIDTDESSGSTGKITSSTPVLTEWYLPKRSKHASNNVRRSAAPPYPPRKPENYIWRVPAAECGGILAGLAREQNDAIVQRNDDRGTDYATHRTGSQKLIWCMLLSDLWRVASR